MRWCSFARDIWGRGIHYASFYISSAGAACRNQTACEHLKSRLSASEESSLFTRPTQPSKNNAFPPRPRPDTQHSAPQTDKYLIGLHSVPPPPQWQPRHWARASHAGYECRASPRIKARSGGGEISLCSPGRPPPLHFSQPTTAGFPAAPVCLDCEHAADARA